MIQSCVTISLVEQARGGPFVFWDDLADAIAKASKLKYDAVELFAPGPDAVKASDLAKMLEDHALALAAVGTGAGWVIHKLQLCDPDEKKRTLAIDFIKTMIDFGGPLGAPAIIGSMQGRHGGDVDEMTAMCYLGEALQELGEHAAGYDVPLIYEPLNRYETNLINRLVDASDFLGTLDTLNVRLLADLFHMNIEEQDVAGALLEAGGTVGHVHFVDSNRRPAGCGHTIFEPIVAALRQIGYEGYVSAEALPYPSPEEAAELHMLAYQKYFPPGEE
ncbi:MAG: TIM barrel protein [Planctomycetes bacterium]|nr:TIM barrel protein [Planctomycetota bacterium]